MSDNYFGALSRCALVSAGLLVGSTVLQVAQLWTMLLTGAPLVYYHMFYLRPRAASGLSPAAIDSVYYFGFLITVAALATSAVAIAGSGAAASIDTVLLQFGIGLFATGYAVLARMHLSSISRLVDQASPEALMDRYVRRSLELVDNVEAAVVRTAELSNTILLKTSEIAETARAGAEKSLLDVTRAFEKEMSTTLASTREGLAGIRNLVADTTFASEREQLVGSIRATVETSTRLNDGLELLAARVLESARANGESFEASTKLLQSLHDMQSNIGVLAAADGPLARSAEAVGAAGSVISAELTALGEVVTHLKAIAGDVASMGPTFRNLRSMSKKTSEQLETLAGVTRRFDEILAGVSGKDQLVGQLVTEIERAAKALPQLTAVTELLTTGLSQAVGASSNLQQEVARIPQQTEAISGLSQEVVASLRSIVQSIERAAEHSQSLQANNADALKLVDGARQLLSGAGSLQATIESLQNVIDAFAVSMAKAQTGVLESSEVLKTSIANSASKLEADLHRSTHATTLLTDRLIQVAQNIIDRTRAHQGARV